MCTPAFSSTFHCLRSYSVHSSLCLKEDSYAACRMVSWSSGLNVAALRVNAVIVGSLGADMDSPYGHIGTKHGVDLPHGGADKGDAFHQYVFASNDLDEIGP